MKILPFFVATTLLYNVVGAEPAAGFREQLTQLDGALETLLKESGVPGAAVAIVYRDQVVYLKGFGVRQAGHPEVVDADTVFQLASCSKPMTSTAVASLVSKHRIDWDDPVFKYLPDFQLEDGWVTRHLTIRDSLSHRTGLPGFAGDVLESLGFDRTEILQRLQYLKPAYGFRSGYAYTNYGFTLGGEAAARAGGVSFEDMLQQEVFGPLQMTSSSARFRDFRDHPNHAHTHMLENGKARATQRNPDPQAPAGGVSSSARDLSRWAQFHLDLGKFQGKQVISAEALEQTYRVHALTRDNPGDFSSKGYYGLGWALAYDARGRYRINHAGAFSIGARTTINLIPEEHLGIVVLANAFPSGLPEGIAAGIVDLYDTGKLDLDRMRSVNKQVSQAMSRMVADKPLAGGAQTTPALAPSAYLGEFRNQYLGSAIVSYQGDRLMLRLGNQNLVLTHLTRDTFTASGGQDFEFGPFQVTFVLDGSGKAVGFRQDGLAPVGSDYFERP